MSAPDSATVLERLTKLHPKAIDLSLGRVEQLLADIGHPERQLAPVIHIAGTNGKGSVVAYLKAIFEAAGLAAHVYISPHLVRFNERIAVRGRMIDDGALVALLEECERVNADRPITFFEVTTAAAFLAFARTPADVVILETGLGGRLDATNVIARPAATVITPISFDHEHYLGTTLAAIAGEKAGIIKPDVVCLSAQQLPEAATVIAARAKSQNAPLRVIGADIGVQPTADGFVLETAGQRISLPLPGLIGGHQIGNAALAAATVAALPQFAIDEVAMARGLREAQWPARLQRLQQGPLAQSLPAGWELWLDGGHNPAAGEVIAAHAGKAWTDRPLSLIVGMLNTKDRAGFLRPLAARAERLEAVAIPGEKNSLPAEDVAATAQGLGLKARVASSIAAALTAIVRDAPTPGRILICGSLYLAGTVLKDNG
ncbi:MAG: bifunctional folylpolyglutamate synthase/dihydrofolate synthase [Rhodospirillales bacterium]|nr:bifunctional folylpolyglutamate synthase/dihydrofolate synthase [Rhodospirillales bacterium]